ncbi:sigma factor-like helix-turn-helix DNA-binding protein [Clostridium sp.]|uniref:sigma factor-like helix-turn-helix DNA-binding protein n=1 Tax=Clostridium sp. TaxID=1506 RepID=UPI00359FDA13
MVDKKKMVEKMLKDYPINVVIIKNIDLDIEDINCSASPDLKELERINHIKKQKQFEVKKVNNILSGLTDRELKIIQMKYFNRISYKDIAMEMDLSMGYVMQIKSNIIKELVGIVFRREDYKI